MIGRLIVLGVYVLTAAALLLSTTFAPMRLHNSFRSAVSCNAFARNLAGLNGGHGHGGHIRLSTDSSFRAAESLPAGFEDELDADIEDELTVASPPASVILDVAPTLSLKPHRQQLSFAVAPAARPLRC